MLNRAEKRIARAYRKPGHPIAFSAPAAVARHFGISERKARRILEYTEGYTRHREYKRPARYNPYYVHGRRQEVQADLVDMSVLARENRSVKFLLVLIDIFTKRLWVHALPNKRGGTVAAKLRAWLRLLRTKPKKLKTDRGLEFTNALVQHLLRQAGVEWEAATGTMKACFCERVNKSLQILIYKYLTENETLSYIDVLPQLVATYNKRGHRTLEGMSPLMADKVANEGRVQAILHQQYADRAGRRRTAKFRVGDMVRVKTQPKKVSSSARAYAEQFKGEYFRVVRINRTLPIPMYYLRSYDTGEIIKDGFYAEELQRQRGDVYKIERVIRRRTRNGVREIYVKWLHFGPHWNEWIPESAVTRAY
jgi:transposase InsO family protein